MSTSHGRFGRSRKTGTVAAGPGLGIAYHYERIWSYLVLKGPDATFSSEEKSRILGMLYNYYVLSCQQHGPTWLGTAVQILSFLHQLMEMHSKVKASLRVWQIELPSLIFGKNIKNTPPTVWQKIWQFLAT